MAETPGKVEPLRGRGRPKVAHPRTVSLHIRLRVVEYDDLCHRASKSNGNVAELSRKAILRLLSE